MRQASPATPERLAATVQDLLTHGVGCAPHVAARLHKKLDGDQTTIRDVAARLDAAQRQGLRPLPSPLPLVAAIEVRYDGLVLDTRDIQFLLALTVCLDDELDPLLVFDGRDVEEIMKAPIGSHLLIHAGRVRLREPLLAIWLAAEAGEAMEIGVHERLSAVFARRGDKVSSDWHRARASLRADPATAPELTRIARELSEAGHQDRALLLATEAAAHATGVDWDEALLVAGVTSVAAGYAAEASAWLNPLFPDGVERYRLEGLGGLVVARTYLHGVVPDVDPGSLRPRTTDQTSWYAWTRAAAFGAVLCAERGDRRGMRGWLQALRDGCERTGTERDLRDPVVSLAWLLAGEADDGRSTGSGPLTGTMLRALRAAVAGDVDLGLRMLARADSGIGAEVDPFVAGFEYSPLVGAYLAIVEVLLLFWRGDVGQARRRLLAAANELPVALPFAGLGVTLARRLDLAVLGHLGPYSLALSAAVPASLRIDQLLDRGIESYLSGFFDDASSSTRLWLDRGAPQPILGVPGLEELTAQADGATARRVEPPESALTRRLILRATTIQEANWRSDEADIADTARTLVSPFARARVEAVLGTSCVIRGETASGRAHLHLAQRLFHDSGAEAWKTAVQGRLARIGDTIDPSGGPVLNLLDPLAACRAAWADLLRERELEVAMLIVEGAMNREIAERLGRSVRTVEVHAGRVFGKLGVRGRVELILLAHRTNRHI